MAEKEEKPPKVNKWDGNAVRNAIDDAIRKILTEKYNYIEKTTLLDTRLTISAIAVAFAGFALLWDWLHPFPKSRPILIICAVSYFILMGILQAYLWLVEKGIFCVVVDRDPTGKVPDTKWSFASKIKKFDDMYDLEVHFSQGDKHGDAKIEKSISSWVDEEGNVVVPLLETEVRKIHDSLAPSKKNR